MPDGFITLTTPSVLSDVSVLGGGGGGTKFDDLNMPASLNPDLRGILLITSTIIGYNRSPMLLCDKFIKNKRCLSIFYSKIN